MKLLNNYINENNEVISTKNVEKILLKTEQINFVKFIKALEKIKDSKSNNDHIIIGFDKRTSEIYIGEVNSKMGKSHDISHWSDSIENRFVINKYNSL